MSEVLSSIFKASPGESVCIGDALVLLAALFKSHGVSEASESAKSLICAAMTCNKASLLTSPTTPIPEQSLRLLCDYAHRRLRKEPISRILGAREFWGLELQITEAVLDPRADTETLVETCLEWVRRTGIGNPKVLDIGTGSGALLCAVLSELPEARGLGIDISHEACSVAQNNVNNLGLSPRGRVLCADLAAFNGSGFDIIVSNPPYIRSTEIQTLEPEVRSYDPHLALDGGVDGLDFYRMIISKYNQWVRGKFLCAVEIGHDQGHLVKSMINDMGLGGTVETDLSGNDRVIWWEGG